MPACRDRLDDESPNLRAAIEDGCVRAPEDALVIVGALGLYWRVRGRLVEGLTATGQSLDAAVPDPSPSAGPWRWPGFEFCRSGLAISSARSPPPLRLWKWAPHVDDTRSQALRAQPAWGPDHIEVTPVWAIRCSMPAAVRPWTAGDQDRAM